MPTQDIIAIGASVGGSDALQTLVAGIGPDIPAAIFIVLHGEYVPGRLPELLRSVSPLPVVYAQDQMPIKPGNIYIAPTDLHLLLETGHMSVQFGAKENYQRPSINPLFRSAAAAYGERVAGVLLTGSGDDGVPGLWEIKRHGGVAIVQDPEDALCPELPRNAQQSVSVDYPVPLADMASLLTRLATEGCEPAESEELGQQVEYEHTELSCPECSGGLAINRYGNAVEFRCTVGHAYSRRVLQEALSVTEENALWAAIRALEQSAIFARQYAKELWPQMEQEAQLKSAQAAAVREILEKARIPAGSVDHEA